eukprot:5670268-Pleurochrysis_carterae.AAC.1
MPPWPHRGPRATALEYLLCTPSPDGPRSRVEVGRHPEVRMGLGARDKLEKRRWMYPAAPEAQPCLSGGS